MPVADREQRVVDRDREEERRPGNEQPAVDVAAGPAGPGRRPHPRLVRRHADHAEERRERDRCAALVRCRTRLRVDPPAEGDAVAERHAPRAGPHLVDPDGEGVPCARSADLDRPAERVTAVEVLGVPLLEELAVGLPAPPGVQRLEPH